MLLLTNNKVTTRLHTVTYRMVYITSGEAHRLDSKNNAIIIVQIVTFTIMNTITIVDSQFMTNHANGS